MPASSSSELAPYHLVCLGPSGSFSYLLAQQRFPEARIEALPSIGEVFDYLADHPFSEGILPIENSSGGFIIDTVDRLLDDRCELWIKEELTLNVKLALIGHRDSPVDVIYSHQMPFYHADTWLKRHHPDARRIVKGSTAIAAELASQEANAAAIGPRQNAERFGLDILHYPIEGEVPNITQFFHLSHRPNEPLKEHQRTALVVELADKPGSLCLFLTPLSDAGINMKRLESRPLRGQPNKYRFYIEIEGSPADVRVGDALAQATHDGAVIRSLGSYSSHTSFET